MSLSAASQFWMLSRYCVSECQTRESGQESVRESVRWQITIAPTIAATRVVRLRHHGRWSRMTPGVAAIVEAAIAA